MKKFLLLALFAIISTVSVNAQKFALMDMEYVLKNIPAYERANEQLTQQSKRWQRLMTLPPKRRIYIRNIRVSQSSSLMSSALNANKKFLQKKNLRVSLNANISAPMVNFIKNAKV